MKAKGYYCAYYRGPQGDEASPEDIAHNILLADQSSAAIQRAFAGTLDLWVPHTQRMINMAWLKGWVDSNNVLELCCDIIREDRPILFVHNREQYLTEGMLEEMSTAVECDCPIIEFGEWDDTPRENAAVIIREWLDGALSEE